MRINMSLNSYDIDALDEIFSISNDLNNKSEVLEILGLNMQKRLNMASDEFTTVNYERVKEAIDSYILKMRIMREELTELSQSCKDFAEKIASIWE